MKTYHLSCHCQAHVVRLNLPDDADKSFEVCNCTYCVKRRTIWAEVEPEQFEFLRGMQAGAETEGKGGSLGAYEFASKNMSHYSCTVCGTHVYSYDRPRDAFFFNMRACRDLDFNVFDLALKIKTDAFDLEPKYKHPALSDLPDAEPYLGNRATELFKNPDKRPMQPYVGACHCQAVKFGVVSTDIEDAKCRMMDCSCSICGGNGVLWIYPGRQNVAFYPSDSDEERWRHPTDQITEYRFANRRAGHYFCSTCHTEIFEYGERPTDDPRPTNGVPEEVLAKRPAWAPENGYNGSFGINVALLNVCAEDSGFAAQVLGVGKLDPRGARLRGYTQSVEDRDEEPIYRLKL